MDKAQQVGGRDIGGRRILERVVVELLMTHHIGIKDDSYALGFVVDQRKGCDGAGRNSQHLQQQLGPAEAEPVAAQSLVQVLQINAGPAQRHDQEQSVFLVLEKQIFGMPARQRPFQARALLDGKDGLVLDRLGADAELSEPRKQVLAGGGQADSHIEGNGSKNALLRDGSGRAQWAVAATQGLLANPGALLHNPVGGRGCSSGVEHHVANVRVEGSNPFARSKSPSRE